MKSKITLFTAFLLFFCLGSTTFISPPVAFAEVSSELRERLRNRLESFQRGHTQSESSMEIRNAEMVKEFYERKGFAFIWLDKNRLHENVQQLIASIKQAGDEGLFPEEYHLQKIEDCIRQLNVDFVSTHPAVDSMKVSLELLLTDAFVLYSSHLLSGRVTPERFDREWVSNKRTRNFTVLLEEAVARNDIDTTLSQLPPSHKEYRALRNALRKYRLTEETPLAVIRLTQRKSLKRGDIDSSVVEIRNRLQAINCLAPDSKEEKNNNALFTKELEDAVIVFQRQFGLEPDGTIGPKTLEALNLSVSKRREQIILNMERWRWLPQSLGEKYVAVNIADYTLFGVENGQHVLKMNVVVGRDYRQTPVFSDLISYIVINPSWNVPPSLAVKDKLPLLRKNPQKLKNEGIRVYQNINGSMREIDPVQINWSSVSAKKFPYTLRQQPGPENALGQIKFMFPNKFNVYLHDTPSKELFNKSVRNYSSGCVRLQSPLKLANFLLQKDERWSPETLNRAIATHKEQTILLAEKIPVHILYMTAFTDENEKIQFRPDVYGRDKLLEKAWNEHRPK